MAQTVFVLGGTGQIGRATARRFVELGWHVVVGARDEARFPDELRRAGVGFARIDRGDPGALAATLGDGVDVLVDVVSMTAADARQLIDVRDRIGSCIAISSASVYADDAGRTLDEATSSDDFPALRVPVHERSPTVEPGDATYSTRKIAMERALLDSALRATVIRPCAVHGPGGRLSREWHFVKRALDGRRVVCLAHRGESRFHTTSVANLAEVIRLAAQRPADRVVNCGDPEPPTVREIGRAVAAALGHEWTEVLLPGEAPSEALSNPWAVPRPFTVDMTEAEIDLGYRSLVRYERAVEETIRWLVDATRDRDWRDVLPGSARHMSESFDYGAEDAYLRSLAP